MRRVSLVLLCVGLSLAALSAGAKDKIRKSSITLPYAAPVAVDVIVPQDEVVVEGNEVDPDLFGGGLIGWGLSKDKNQARTRNTAPATQVLAAATHGVDFAKPIAEQLKPALADGYFSQLGEVRALSGDGAGSDEGDTLKPGKLYVSYRYGMTSDFNYLRIIQIASLAGEAPEKYAYHNFFIYYMRLPETIPMKNSKDRAAAWGAVAPERFKAMVGDGLSTLAKALVFDLKASGEVPKGGKKMIYHDLVPGVLQEAHVETEIDGMDVGRNKDGSVAVLPKDCSEHKCWSIFQTD